MSIKRIDKSPTDEKSERDLYLLERWVLVTDGGGHRYVLPIAEKVEFDAWAEAEIEGEDFDATRFHGYKLDGGLLTFTDPRVN